MKIGLTMIFPISGPFSRAELAGDMARCAESVGFDSIWTPEHVAIPQGATTPYPRTESGQLPGGNDIPILDPLLLLTYAAAVTTKVKLASGVVILPQRHPLYVAKEMVTLDVLSRGRAILGIGSGWFKEEFEALGIDFHVRGARTDESIKAMREVWRNNPASFHGKHFNFGPVKTFPRPVQKGGIPIHVGGLSPAAARRAARYGDGFVTSSAEPNVLTELHTLMREECARLGRNPAEIELSANAKRSDLGYIKSLEDIGVSRAVVKLQQIAQGAIAPSASGPDAEQIKAGLEKYANEVIAKL